MHLPWRELLPAPREERIPVSTSLTVDERNELAALAAGREVLEVGSAYGFSAITMALGGATSVLAVDPHTWCKTPSSVDDMIRNVQAYAVDECVNIVVNTFFNAAASLESQDRKFSLIFIDGDHSYDTVRHDFTHARGLVTPGGVIACHDYLELCCCPEVKQALDELVPEGPAYTVDTLAVYQM